VPGALGGEPEPGHRQAALVAVLVLLLGDLDEARVEDVADLVVDVPRERAQAHTDLVGRQPGPALVVDRLEEVLDEHLHALVDVRDRFARGAQDGVTHDADVSHSHGDQFPTARAVLRHARSPSGRAWVWDSRRQRTRSPHPRSTTTTTTTTATATAPSPPARRVGPGPRRTRRPHDRRRGRGRGRRPARARYVSAMTPRPAWRPEKRQPPRKVPSRER